MQKIKQTLETKRYLFLDALRGVAVLLMMQQHIFIWLWKKSWISNAIMFKQYPLSVVLSFFGNFAAPLFIFLAGASSCLVVLKKQNYLKVLIVRGLVLIVFGYLLNFIVSHWFLPTSWYVLHAIGVFLVLAPLLNKISNVILFIKIIILILLVVVMQTYLNTPLMLSDSQMSSIVLSGGIFRIIFIEGHFPAVAWLVFFICGIVVMRLYLADKSRYIFISALMFLIVAVMFIYFAKTGYAFASRGRFFRLYLYLPYIYPLLPPFMLILLSYCCFMFIAFSKVCFLKNKLLNIFVVLGRSSFSLFVIHIVIFNHVLSSIKLYKSFSNTASLLIMIFSLLVLTSLSVVWSKYKFKYGLEWLLRKIAA